MRLALNAAVLGRLLEFRPRAEGLANGPERSRLFLSRCDDDCRLPPFRFECLAKIVRLGI